MKRMRLTVIIFGALALLAAAGTVQAAQGVYEINTSYYGDPHLEDSTDLYSGNSMPWTHDPIKDGYAGASIFYVQNVGTAGVSTFEIDQARHSYSVTISGITMTPGQLRYPGHWPEWSGNSRFNLVAFYAQQDTPAAWVTADMIMIWRNKPHDSASTPWVYPVRFPAGTRYARLGFYNSGVTEIGGVWGYFIAGPGELWGEPYSTGVTDPIHWVADATSGPSRFARRAERQGGSGTTTGLVGDVLPGAQVYVVETDATCRYYLSDNLDPTTSIGYTLQQGQSLRLSREDIMRFSIIPQAGTADVVITPYSR